MGQGPIHEKVEDFIGCEFYDFVVVECHAL
jgi:hypothetical protein